MSQYSIPPSVFADIENFTKSYNDYCSGKLDELTFKTIRVPFGVYEQREPNTYMIRIKSAGGSITPTQLKGLAQIAKEYTKPHIHITTRGGIQLHYAKKEHLLEIIHKVHALGLSGRGGGGNTVRNIATDPLAGIAIDEAFDVTPYANMLTSKMFAQKDSYNLPRKFKIAFSGSRADRAMATITDVGFIATLRNQEKGFIVYLAGGMGAKSRLGFKFLDFLPDNEAFLLAESVKQVFNRTGNRKNKHAARLRFVVDTLGEEKLKNLIIDEMEHIRNNSDDWHIDIRETLSLEDIDEDEPSKSNEEKKWWDRFVIPQKQKGYYSAKVPLYLGDIPIKSALELAEKLHDKDESIRFASSQNMYLRNLRAQELLEVFPIIKEFSKQSSKPVIIGDMVACTGAATCQLGITRPRGAVSKIEEQLSIDNLDLDSIAGFKIHLSGCPNSCGNHATADLGFFGKVSREDGHPYPAYNVLVGAIIQEGKTQFAKRIAEVSAWALPRFVSEVLGIWIQKNKQYTSFKSWIDDEGEKIISEIAKKYKKVPSFADDKNPYFDFDSDELFSLKGRGSGECSAGMYDLIEADKKALLKLIESIKSNQSQDYDNVCLLACRMLLVTRGEEARDKERVYKSFKTHFIETGLIDKKFLDVIRENCDESILELAQSVIALYETMDNNFQFHVSQQTQQVQQVQQVQTDIRFKDYRNVACPMNFVKTKMDLSQMKSGELLEILLDDGAPIENVPGSVKSEGHHVLNVTQEKQGHWRVRIQKK